ncbi:hypothetical protein M513_11236 [Trichuris suis]|uniref:Rad21/Rec8-like protein N-terminal domain-containing protein n=1 Tax=Trichuris suis TaxID=68888 RepID=A0A085LSD7_9BILA|nr:hypothetical protein M513_11236 [Trichuris suis]
MFYSWNILARKDGKFSVIWLAATRERKLSKKQCESVNLCNSCSELCKHIPSPDRVKSVERFSLYLCSQLMFGIVVIFNRKHEYLLRELEQILSKLRQISVRTLQLPILSSKIEQNDDQNILHDVQQRLERSLDKDQFSLEDTIDELPLNIESASSVDLVEFLSAHQREDAITMEETIPRRKPSEFEDLIPDFFGEASALEDFPLDLAEYGSLVKFTEIITVLSFRESQSMSIVDVHSSEEPLQTEELAKTVGAVSGETISNLNNENLSATIIAPKNAFDQFQTSTPVSFYLSAKPLRTHKKRMLHDRRTTLQSSVIRKQLDNYTSTVLPLQKVLGKEQDEESTSKDGWMKQPGMRILSWRLAERYQRTLHVPDLTELSRGDLVSEAILEKPMVPEPFVDGVQSNTESSLEIQRGRTLDSTGILRNVGSSADEMVDSVRHSRGVGQVQSLDENFHSDVVGQLENLVAPDSTGITELIAYDRAEKCSLDNKVVESDNSRFDDQLLKKIYEMAKDKDYTTFADLCPREITTRKTAALVFNSLLALHSIGKLSIAQGEYMSDIRIWTSPDIGSR